MECGDVVGDGGNNGGDVVGVGGAGSDDGAGSGGAESGSVSSYYDWAHFGG